MEDSDRRCCTTSLSYLVRRKGFVYLQEQVNDLKMVPTYLLYLEKCSSSARTQIEFLNGLIMYPRLQKAPTKAFEVTT